jgi:hypothetical protein
VCLTSGPLLGSFNGLKNAKLCIILVGFFIHELLRAWHLIKPINVLLALVLYHFITLVNKKVQLARIFLDLTNKRRQITVCLNNLGTLNFLLLVRF